MVSKLQRLPQDLGILGWDSISPTFFCAWIANIPCVFIGDPGAAKTTFQVRFARALELKLDVLDLQYLSTTRLLGIPNPEKLRVSVLEYVGGLLSTKPDVVILDELNRCQDQVQGIILEFLREGRLNNSYLKCKRVASCNPPANNLVGVHYLDYAQATRLIHIPIPNLSISLREQFIEDWNVQFVITPETKLLCQELNSLELLKPNPAHVKSIAIALLDSFNNIPVSGRQIDLLLRLLSASWTLEANGFHSFTGLDIARLGASIIPFQLTRNSWNISDGELFATQISKRLPDFPWKSDEVIKTQNLSVQVEQTQMKFQMMEIESILPHCKGTSLENFIAFEVFVAKAASDPRFQVEFDNWDLLEKLR
jgi:hypothetical protein